MNKVLGNYLKYWLIPLLLAGFFMAKFWPDLETRELNVDEVFNLKKAPYLELYLKGDFFNSRWSEWEAYDQPMLANFVYGASIFDLAVEGGGYQAFLTQNNFYDDGKAVCAANPAAGNYGEWWWCHNLQPLNTIKADFEGAFKILLRARIVGLSLMVLIILATYFAGLEIGGTLMGLVAALWFGFYPLTQVLAPQAMIDQVLVLMTYWQFLILVYWYKYPGKQKVLLPILGIVTGLAAAAKLNGFLALPMVGLLVLLFSLKQKQLLKGIKQATLIILIALLTFVALNPYLWPNIPERMKIMWQWRVNTGLGQQKALPDMAVKDARDGFNYLKTELFYKWDWQAAKNGGFSLSFLTLIFGWLLLPFLALARFLKKEKQKSTEWLLWIYSLIMVWSLPFYIPMKWVRYLLPALPAIGLVQGYLASKLIDLGRMVLIRKPKNQ